MNLAFYHVVGRLKDLPRTGWVQRGIPNPETVAEHMYRSQFLAYDLAKQMGADPAACAHMMMIHDLQEALVGDMTPDSISKEEKHRLELKAAEELATLSGNPEFLDVFLEYEDKTTLRAQVCGDADKLEMCVQALEYARLYPEKRPVLETFWTHTEPRLMTAPAKAFFADLVAQKDAL